MKTLAFDLGFCYFLFLQLFASARVKNVSFCVIIVVAKRKFLFSG